MSDQPDKCHSLQAQSHSPGTFDEAIFSRYVFRNVCAGALLVTGAHMSSTWLTCKLWESRLQYLMHDTNNTMAKGQGRMTPLLCLLSLSSGICGTRTQAASHPATANRQALQTES